MGFQPFKDDPRKQARYTAYLGSQASSQPMELQPLPGQSIEDFNAELEGFQKAARIFKPMSAAMANRFRTSSGVETTAQPQEGLYQPTDEAYAQHEAKTRASASEKIEVEETPKEHAAKMGMFGAMTRERADWVPAKLLCKRFRVPPPKVTTSDAREEDSNANQFSSSSSSYPAPPLASMEFDTAIQGDHIKVIPAESARSGDSSGKRDMANIGLGEDDSQGRETLTYERPAMDIFKAIFASDEEGSDDEMEVKGPLKQSEEVTTAPVRSSVTASATSNPTGLVVATAVTPGAVDLTTFRPTFVARSDRGKLATDVTTDKSRKGSKKKSKVVAPLSFMEDDAGSTVVPVVKKRKRDKDLEGKSAKKKRDKESQSANLEPTTMVVDEEDDDVWVEKPPAIGVQQPAAVAPDLNEKISTGKSRPRASDFL
jgi:G patch domain-containing protein 1